MSKNEPTYLILPNHTAFKVFFSTVAASVVRLQFPEQLENSFSFQVCGKLFYKSLSSSIRIEKFENKILSCLSIQVVYCVSFNSSV